MQTSDLNSLNNSILLGPSSGIIKNIPENPQWQSSVETTSRKLDFSIIEFRM